MLDVLGIGTEAGRAGRLTKHIPQYITFNSSLDPDHELHWPLWVAGTTSAVNNGSIAFNREFSGVADFGEFYAGVSFPATGDRQIFVGWTYEDEEGVRKLKYLLIPS